MAQKGKQWLRRKSAKGKQSFTISGKEGGLADSLIGLGYLSKDQYNR